MNPTLKLRYVERLVPINPYHKSLSDQGLVAEMKTDKILQQWWENPKDFDFLTCSFNGEWRDVPVEKE